MPRDDMSRGGSGRAGVNKNFLLNTVHGLKSHNKREEEEDCWRQHGLEQRARERLLAHDANRNRRNVPADGGDTSASHASDVDARRFWAERKERTMTATTPAIDPSAAAAATGGSSPSVDRKRQREDSEEGTGRANGNRGDRRKKDDKKKGNKKKKKKRKRESRDRAGSDDERGAVGVGNAGGDEEARRRHKRSKKRAQKRRNK
ncbi:expressed unknown protein [Ectocarpus siliculosus]|uniref:Uncharacterized protein n=1 Tax=Ectocarpus siliculosus TaxID=2880 RepID=D7FTY1_ECTSI|nr:expressed unknown protein [Ectocarpus siliculosus]|eukprot:CBJ31508.1 expressed unknown protein [Ectocarpus siliculosus]